ncbi:AraC family transcriptional regulator [Flavobacterium ranwuense]|uniref:AraC family transcriptional regulator n=1 Tax=Flavobacterium ranwuense TaxID=2541725 RepID=A0ABY2DN59_9FLAO|nr:GyrI-like domain-containing protein [Flavobacterium ranwuense]TDE27440.1 AraC family transcriptional regulator [Flavobacterium ranwuense]
MIPRIETLPEKKFVGRRITLSLSNNKTAELWKSFMPRRKEIQNSIGTDLYSMQKYDASYFNTFNPNAEFEKWAAVAVTDFNEIPEAMEPITLTGGLYAVFIHKGDASTASKTFQYIFETWLPNSEYILDDRMHFELLGEKYKNNDPSSEEEIWIPIQLKK